MRVLMRVDIPFQLFSFLFIISPKFNIFCWPSSCTRETREEIEWAKVVVG